MFDPSESPRLFGLPPGVDFAKGFVDGLIARTAALSPEAMGRVEVFVNTRRMQRRMRAIFDAGPARLLPRLRLVTDLAFDPISLDVPPPVAPIRRRLDLTRLVGQLLDAQPDLAPRSALYDLSDSLARLMDEMQGEGVTPARIAALDVSDQSGHWARSLQFLNIIQHYLGDRQDAPDTEARQRMVIDRLIARWAETPPEHPVLIAGSTGSRGTTARLMSAVTQLPQGAVVLPGFDFDMPAPVWDRLTDPMLGEDHPQFRFRRLMDMRGVGHEAVKEWHKAPPACPARNRLVSLSLRPAPVTDQWLTEGPKLNDLAEATEGMTLVEAPSPRAEAETIALRLRQAVENGETAALITPDRMLTRQVAAALGRWNITPDDSAGMPLNLSPPGRFLRHVSQMWGRPMTAEAMLTLLKHPLAHSDRADRGQHLLRTHELELHLRRKGPAFPDAASLSRWAALSKTDTGRVAWAGWVGGLIDGVEHIGDRPLIDHLTNHMAQAERLAAGPEYEGAGALWSEAAGRKAREVCDTLLRHADAGGVLSVQDYASLFNSVLSAEEVRNPDTGHPQVLFWGTLEARVQGADLVILGGMNDGTWPETPSPDPWLSRRMRAEARLLLPDRRIGLSAHDYQQAVAGRQVWITRSIRSADAQTVPSRWINRLVNLLQGLEGTGGRAALEQMRARGQVWVDMARKTSLPSDTVPMAPRPSPRPPIAARPRDLSVTQIKTLIRDPFAIYARKVLRLDVLDPLVPSPDAPLRGTLIHKILEIFVGEGIAPDDPNARKRLMEVSRTVFKDECPWPTIRRLWIARMDRIATEFLDKEVARRAIALPEWFEVWGELGLNRVDFTIKGKADRIDLAADGSVILYDYKTGQVSTEKQQLLFDKQLLIQSAMIERGAYAKVGPSPVLAAAFVQVATTVKDSPAPFAAAPPDTTWEEFQALIYRWMQIDKGYTARQALFSRTDSGPYDHLSRFGEWDTSQPAVPVILT